MNAPKGKRFSESDLFRADREAWSRHFMMKRLDTVDTSTDPNDTYEDDHYVLRMEGFGDIMVPKKNEFGLLWTGGQGGAAFPLSSPTYRPDTGKSGSRGLYCSVPGALFMLRGDEENNPGQVEINSGTPSGGTQADVVVNGGTLPVARKTDPVNCGVFALAQAPNTPGPGQTTVTITYTPPGGGAPQQLGVMVFTGTATAGAATVSGQISGGASHFKG